MTVIRVTQAKAKGLPTNCTVGESEVFGYTLKVRQWENVADRPETPEASPTALSVEARHHLIDWLKEDLPPLSSNDDHDYGYD